jgi:GNAT superfamily N-acetyltransferase
LSHHPAGSRLTTCRCDKIAIVSRVNTMAPARITPNMIEAGHTGAAFTIRLATLADIPILADLISNSARALSPGFYTPAQTESAIRYVFGVDTRLIVDGTYYVAVDHGTIVGCGGWSWRSTLYGGDQRPMGEGAVLDPAVDAARIRAFFIAGTHARRGIGATLLDTCADAARAQGFRRLELMSTMPGVPFYAKLGFREVHRVVDALPDGTPVEFVQMTRAVDHGARPCP